MKLPANDMRLAPVFPRGNHFGKTLNQLGNYVTTTYDSEAEKTAMPELGFQQSTDGARDRP